MFGEFSQLKSLKPLVVLFLELIVVSAAFAQTQRKAPIPAANPGIVYHSSRQKNVLFGGRDDNEIFGTTWEWNGTQWKQISVENPPSKGGLPGLTFDSIRGKLILFGGGGDTSGYLEGTWEWDGKNWKKVCC